MKTVNRIGTFLLGLFVVAVSIAGLSEGMLWGGLILLLIGALLIFGAISGRWWLVP